MKKWVGLVQILSVLILASCANERPAKSVLLDNKRIKKSDLQGTYHYLKSLTSVRFNGDELGEELPTGAYLDHDQLVRFEMTEHKLQVVSVDPLYRVEKDAERNRVLASFNIRHVDVLRKKNQDDQDTHEEELTETRRVWNERDYVIVDLETDTLDVFVDRVKTMVESQIVMMPQDRVIQFDVTKQLSDDTLIKERYSFKVFENNPSYVQREYPRDLQSRFGFFKATTYQTDSYGRFTDSLKRDFISRFDTSKKIIYYLSKDFPAHLAKVAEEVFLEWNEVFKGAVGRDVLELRPNSGQEAGDLRYNLVYYEHSIGSNGLLGYGPSLINPRTGEIIKGDVFLYGGTLKRSLHNERIWEGLLGGGSITGVSEPIGVQGQAFNVDLMRSFDASTSARYSIDGLKNFKASFKGDETLKKLKEKSVESFTQRMTHLDVEVMTQIREARLVKDMTDEELETFIFKPLLSHELGHNFGLRHNFMASADEKHFDKDLGTKSSSVMDYGFLATHESPKPGQYDRAAIQFGYGEGVDTQKLVSENYYFCTDQDIYSSQNGLCHTFDAGLSLTDVTTNQMRRYLSTYVFNNLRLGRANFESVDMGTYLGRIIPLLLPLRLNYDHATGIIRLEGKYLSAIEKGDVAAIGRVLLDLWGLLRQRVEADSQSVFVFPVQVDSTLTVNIDMDKLLPIFLDARKAQALAYNALRYVVLEEERQDYDGAHFAYGDLLVRGVLWDRLMALYLLSIPTPDPQSSGSPVTVFQNDEKGLPHLFAQLLSNTRINPIGSTLYGFNGSLREYSLELITNVLASPNLLSAEARELLAVTAVKPVDIGNLQQISNIRSGLIDVFKNLYRDDLSAEDRKKLVDELNRLVIERNAFPIADIHSRGQHLKATLSLNDFGQSLESATGHMIKANLNMLEDEVTGALSLVSEYESQIVSETDEAKKRTLLRKKEKIKVIVKGLRQILSKEKRFFENMVDAYMKVSRSPVE